MNNQTFINIESLPQKYDEFRAVGIPHVLRCIGVRWEYDARRIVIDFSHGIGTGNGNDFVSATLTFGFFEYEEALKKGFLTKYLKEQPDDEYRECEHGLSADLCAGPQHYPYDNDEPF